MIQLSLSILFLFLSSTVLVSESLAVNLPKHFLIASFPKSKKIGYFLVDKNKPQPATPPSEAFTDLVDTGLLNPIGVAVNSKSSQLFVADKGNKIVYGYTYTVAGDSVSVASNRQEIVTNIDVEWISVDSEKNALYVSSVANNAILKVDLNMGALSGNYEAVVLFHGLKNGGTSGSEHINSPTGVAVDPTNGEVYWGNMHDGLNVGAVAKANTDTKKSMVPLKLGTSEVTDTVKGICLSNENVLYTDSKNGLYSVKKGTGNPVQITTMLHNANGCAWDGDGTIYVADGKAVYRLPGNQKLLRPMLNLETVVTADDVSDVTLVDAWAPGAGGNWIVW